MYIYIIRVVCVLFWIRFVVYDDRMFPRTGIIYSRARVPIYQYPMGRHFFFTSCKFNITAFNSPLQCLLFGRKKKIANWCDKYRLYKRSNSPSCSLKYFFFLETVYDTHSFFKGLSIGNLNYFFFQQFKSIISLSGRYCISCDRLLRQLVYIIYTYSVLP